jgi:hypothetical protein
MERYGLLGSEVRGVFFTESTAIDGARQLGDVAVEIGGQNKDIGEVKLALAEKVQALGGNALVGFRYGQKGNPWYRSLSGLFDAEHWYGSGTAVIAPSASAER